MDIIDSHSHIGYDNAWELEGNLHEYLENVKNIGITESLIMPVPMPIIKISNNEIIPIMLGEIDNEYYIVQGLNDKNGMRATIHNNNPYKLVNELLYNKLCNCNSNINLHFIPLIHPVFDELDYLEEIIDKYNPIALKIHGYSSIISPYDINEDFFKLIESYNIPLIIHTDCDTSSYTNNIDYIYRNENSPINWLSSLDKYSIKAYLTHGVRLSRECFDIINNNSNYIVGLGPDKVLSSCKDRMYSNDLYLDTLFSNLDINKICFDIDYPWNVSSYDNLCLDWDSINRINNLNLNDEEKEKVLSKNSKNFYNL